MNVNPALKSMAEEENAFQQAAPMLFGEEFAKKATERVEAVKAINKITFSKPGEKRQSHFFGYHRRNQQDGCGSEDHSSFQTKHPRTEEQLETYPVHCLVKNIVCQPTPQVGANRQYQLDAILPFIKKGLVALVHAGRIQFYYTQLGSNY